MAVLLHLLLHAVGPVEMVVPSIQYLQEIPVLNMAALTLKTIRVTASVYAHVLNGGAARFLLIAARGIFIHTHVGRGVPIIHAAMSALAMGNNVLLVQDRFQEAGTVAVIGTTHGHAVVIALRQLHNQHQHLPLHNQHQHLHLQTHVVVWSHPA